MTNEHFQRKKGRPQKCPIDCLQTQVLMHSLCEELGVPHTGGQLERIFEKKPVDGEDERDDGTRQRNGKFRRLMRGLHSASHRTIETIFSNPNTTDSKALRNSSLWQALKYGENTPNWLNFFKTLRPSLQDIALTTNANNQLIIKRVNRYTGGRLLKEGDIEALACAIAIHRATPLTVWQYKLSSAICKLLGWTLANPAFVESTRKLCDLICNRFRAMDFDAEIYDKNFCCPSKEQPFYTIFDLANKNTEFISRAKAIGLIRHDKDLKHLVILSEQGDKQRIFEEMEQVLTKQDFQLIGKGKGLYWFVTELNKHHRKKIDLFNVTGTFNQTLGLHRIITLKND